MDPDLYQETVRKMTADEKLTAIVFYLKDIKDLLESICDHKEIPKKHY